MTYTIEEITSIVKGELIVQHPGVTIEYLLLDSRKVLFPAVSLFLALQGPRRDGHQFIQELYEKGIRNFIISKKVRITDYPAANFITVKDCLKALQDLTAWHR